MKLTNLIKLIENYYGVGGRESYVDTNPVVNSIIKQQHPFSTVIPDSTRSPKTTSEYSRNLPKDESEEYVRKHSSGHASIVNSNIGQKQSNPDIVRISTGKTTYLIDPNNKIRKSSWDWDSLIPRIK